MGWGEGEGEEHCNSLLNSPLGLETEIWLQRDPAWAMECG